MDFFLALMNIEAPGFLKDVLRRKLGPMDVILAGKKAHEYFGILVGSLRHFLMEVGQEILVPGNLKSKHLYREKNSRDKVYVPYLLVYKMPLCIRCTPIFDIILLKCR